MTKITAKQLMAKFDNICMIESKIRGFEIKNEITTEFFQAKEELKEAKKEINSFAKTAVKYSMGQRSFYDHVIKIGKSYHSICSREKMTKGRGYRNIKEIEEITEEMSLEMSRDAHYY